MGKIDSNFVAKFYEVGPDFVDAVKFVSEVKRELPVPTQMIDTSLGGGRGGLKSPPGVSNAVVNEQESKKVLAMIAKQPADRRKVFMQQL